MIPAAELKRLREIASMATPGPWHTDHNDTFVATPYVNGDWDWITGDMGAPANDYEGEVNDEDCRGKNIKNNCRYIAAFNPQTALALIAEIKRLRDLVLTATEILSHRNSECGTWNDHYFRKNVVEQFEKRAREALGE